MNVSRIILDLLTKNHVVSIPNLGRFTYSYVSAEVYKFTNRVAPPAYKLEFFDDIDVNDKSLIETYSMEYDTPLDESTLRIRNWVVELKLVLERVNSLK